MARFVPVHGGWHGGWCWKRVTPLLRAAGHEVDTPTLTGLGERSHLASPEINFETHVQDIINLLEYEDLHAVILVGHSLGGTVIEAAAHRVPERIAHLIFLDALIPEDGKSAFDLWIDHGFGAAVRQAQEHVEREGDGWYIAPHTPDSTTLGVTDEADIQWMSERLEPIPVETMRQPVRLGNPEAEALPRAYIRCTETETEGLIPSLAERVRDDSAWTYRKMAACHDVMVTEPGLLAEMLIELVSSPSTKPG